MAIDEKQIEEIVRGVVNNLITTSGTSTFKASPGILSGNGIFEGVKDAVSAAKDAQPRLVELGREARFEIIANIKKRCLENAEKFARLTVDETGIGVYEDKIIKNQVAVNFSPGPEDLDITTYSNEVSTISIDRAPYGLIAAITPMTNPTPGIINNSIIMISAGNSIVFLPHPEAHNCSLEAIKVIHNAIVEAGGPANLVTAARQSKVENVSVAFKSDKVDMITATGGPGIVRLSMKSGKKVIGAGPGNPPVIVDETADIESAAVEIMNGASFDNNILCNEEKACICIRSISDKLLSAFSRNSTMVLNIEQAEKVVNLVVKDGEINKDYIGKDASKILTDAGINADPGTRLVVFVADSESHPIIQHEQLMPVLPILLVDSFEEAMAAAVRIEHGFGHTAMIHSKDIDRITRFGQIIDTTNLIVNARSQAMAADKSKGGTAWTIAGATGEGNTTPRSYTKERRIYVSGAMNFVK
ncbi:MAG: aldehyde dehydrogenase family protein [Actinomycetota bacterium]|nr:MAG: aldehyde dehydrogenase family protein [Actinomycetota bacterium]